MRKITHIVVHCSAGPQAQSTTSIKQYWAKKLGWKSYGYHYIINGNGSVEKLTPEAQPSNGVKGYNSRIINVCYKGGQDGTDTRTPPQKRALLALLSDLAERYPEAAICGHRDFSPDLNEDGRITPNEYIKLCPCFDAKAEYAHLTKWRLNE